MDPFLAAFLPRASPLSVKERLRSSIGALMGILATGLVCRAAVGNGAALPILIAPMGASAVLLFAVPASPLAQPWAIIGGNLISALVGVTATILIQDQIVAASLAVAASIALMSSLRCVHPPSGAVALTAVLGGHAVGGLGYGFVCWPVGANSLLLVAAALLFNNLTGRAYPNRPTGTGPDRASHEGERFRHTGFGSEDLDAVLKEWDQPLEVDRDDLEAILRQAELRSYRRRASQTTCATIMTRNVVAVGPDSSITEAFDLLRRYRIKMLPVTDEHAHVLGMVTQTDLLDKAAWDLRGPRLSVRHRLRISFQRGRAPHGCVGDIMTAPVATVTPESTLADVVWSMAHTGHHLLPVVHPSGQLAGVVAQSDVVLALVAETKASDPRDRLIAIDTARTL